MPVFLGARRLPTPSDLGCFFQEIKKKEKKKIKPPTKRAFPLGSSFIINKFRVASLRNDHQDDVNCLDFKRNPAHFHAFVILHELNTLM